MDKSIMPECYADTLLIETLVPTTIGYNHQTGCFKVEREMKLGKLKDRFAVGIIDNDKVEIKYLREFEVIDKVEGALVLWRHKDKAKHHFIIQICPALEKWILEVCTAEGIILTEFGLANDLENLKEFSKSRSSIKEEKLIALFKEINKKTENVSVRKLKSWVTLLKERNYQVDVNALKNGGRKKVI
jgi:hypothetical protein